MPSRRPPTTSKPSTTTVDGQEQQSTPARLLASLTADIDTLEAERETAIARAVAAGARWTEIGTALGVSSQGAHKRYRWLRRSTTTGETWHEPPLPR